MNKLKKISTKNHGINAREISKNTCSILKALTKAGYEAYLVGGAVRDLLLGLHPKDFDVATNATPEQVKAVLPSTRIIGRRFRLAHVYFGREFIEVATFRAPHEHSTDGKVADSGRIINDNVYGTLEQDAVRRDFTVNALFYDLKTQTVIDFVDGMTDLNNRTLKLIGDPQTRYKEDPVRMLRAIRFAIKLNFQIDSESREPIFKMGHLLSQIAPARLFDETLKLFHGGKAWQTFNALQDYQVFKLLFPLTEKHFTKKNVDEDTLIFRKLVEGALKNTDKRIVADKPVTPAFLFAVMLWKDVDDLAEEFRNQGDPFAQSVQFAANDIFSTQIKSISVPKRFSIMAKEMWILQGRFRFKSFKKAMTLLENRRFRAAYDLMCLRADAGEPLEEDANWWTLFQEVDEKEKIIMCEPYRFSKKRKSKTKSKHKKA